MSKARKFQLCMGKISIVEIERETDSMVWVNGRRYRKHDGFELFFDTFEAAKTRAIQNAQYAVDSARRVLGYANDKLGNAKGLKDPSVLNGSESASASSNPNSVEAA